MSQPVLEVRDLTKRYPVRGGLFSAGRSVHALEGVTLSVARGETLAIVGESGCGKSTFARCVVRLEDASAGSVILNGADITRTRGRALRSLRRHL
ncbi:MAG: ABC transporter ATP-binding protein, partial [Rhodospirillales bacterium]|nr:ABC transporter ATP-binding protein [Rhodospirillales bacterium]